MSKIYINPPPLPISGKPEMKIPTPNNGNAATPLPVFHSYASSYKEENRPLHRHLCVNSGPPAV